MRHLVASWRKVAVGLRWSQSPIAHASRLSLTGGPVAPEIVRWRRRREQAPALYRERTGKAYVPVWVRQQWDEPPVGYRYFNPDVGPHSEYPHPTASEDTVGFIDYHDLGTSLSIMYMSVRPDQRGKGLARQMLTALYDRHPDATIDWGKLMQAETGHLHDWFVEHRPDQTGSGVASWR